ncbi:hypothetical protein ACODT5_00910 [Streptomyces sp. 5.8]|uniref:hypothetical protein n=1 Tax=Streptomyces sp. 5.8 TaxID=3406571 RepID=UPI003BB4C45E
MDRNETPDRQTTEAATGTAALDETLFLPGRIDIPTGMTKGSGTKWPTTSAARMALIPQFMEPLGLHHTDDDGDEAAGEH